VTAPPVVLAASPPGRTGRRREVLNWLATLAATLEATCALDGTATVTGLGLAAVAGPLRDLPTLALVVLLVVSYLAWGLGMKANLRANRALLTTTGTSTSGLSKAAFDVVRHRTSGDRAAHVAAAVGYVAWNVAFDIPYYTGAFGAAALSETITSQAALVFLMGANLGAAVYEYGIAGLTRAFLERRASRRAPGYASFDADWVPAEYLAGYYRDVEPDETATIAFLVDAMRLAEPGRPVLFFGVGPTLHHVFAAAEVASEIHLGDYLLANLREIRRWIDRDSDAHDWRPFIRYTLRCEGLAAPSDEDVAAREELTRKKITELVTADAGASPPLHRQYATVVSAYCADSATGERRTWELFMRNITGLVQPGGLFVTAALRRCRGYTVAGKVFPSADVDEHDLRAVLRPAFTAATVEVRGVDQDASHGYSGIVLAWARRRPPEPEWPALALVGADTTVPLVDGSQRRYVDLDHAASTSCLATVRRAVDELMPWYSSVHRGAGYKSQVTTDAYEGAREAVRSFVGGREDDVVVFTRNTTDATNLLASALPADTEVIGFAAEHHANLLPWRRRAFTLLPLPAGPADALDRLDRALARPARGRRRLVAVTGASNVTGEIWPYAELAQLAHRHGARIMVDAAQLAPHRPIDMAADGIDYLALSGHKLYAPLGSGALVGRRDWLAAGEPFLAGGGAVRYVGTGTVVWAGLPDRQEAGSPNVVGAVALGVACRTLQAADRPAVEAHQARLAGDTRARLLAVPGVQMLRLWAADHPRIAVLPFTLRHVPYATVAAALSAEHGVGVRHGCFCAHPLMAALLRIDARTEAHLRDSLSRDVPVAVPGAVRASIGIGTTADDCDRLVEAVTELSVHGPRWTYISSADGTDCRPSPDPRRRPVFSFELASPALSG
jgi:selenocysteine lyase/cysteine desulfurase